MLVEGDQVSVQIFDNELPEGIPHQNYSTVVLGVGKYSCIVQGKNGEQVFVYLNEVYKLDKRLEQMTNTNVAPKFKFVTAADLTFHALRSHNGKTGKSRRYDKDFKAAAIQFGLDNNIPAETFSQLTGVHATTVHSWYIEHRRATGVMSPKAPTVPRKKKVVVKGPIAKVKYKGCHSVLVNKYKAEIEVLKAKVAFLQDAEKHGFVISEAG